MYSFNIAHSPFWLFLSLLPPANEVWGKVIFSEVCVKNSVHWGESAAGGMPSPGGMVPGGAWSSRGAWSRDECLVRGDLVQGRGYVWRPPMTATAAGCTHPTGMHSCS